MPDDLLLHLLILNSGSSSLKFALYDGAGIETPVLAGKLARIGQPDGQFTVSLPGGDPVRNARNASVISPDGSRVTVRVIPTNEEQMIARHTRDVLSNAN